MTASARRVVAAAAAVETTGAVIAMDFFPSLFALPNTPMYLASARKPSPENFFSVVAAGQSAASTSALTSVSVYRRTS